MDFELSEDQRALQEAARDLLDDHAAPERVRAHMATREPYDAKLWSAMVEQGWTGIMLPEPDGGLGFGWVEAAVLLEEVGRHVAPAPFLPTLLALEAFRAAGQPEWVGRLASGDAVGCVAWDVDPATVEDHGDGTISAERLGPVIAAPAADVAVVATPAAVFAVDLSGGDGAGGAQKPGAEPAMDETRALGWLRLDHVPATPLGGAAEAAALLDRGAVGYAAELLGGAGAVLDMASQYAKDRVQFGQPIGSFQAVKHRCADMVVDVEGMRSTTWWAAWCLAAAHPDAGVAASAAKTWCSDAAKRVMASGLQVHGGIGFTWEHDLHLFLKRSQLDQLSFGDATWHRERLAGLLRARVAEGASVI